MDDLSFAYQPACSMPGCGRAPAVKLAAAWSFGPLRERKNYGLSCPGHQAELLALARERRGRLVLGDDEQVGPVEAIPLPQAPPTPAAETPA